MLCCPSTKGLRARRRARKQARQQRRALEEARAAGWKRYDANEQDEEDDTELDNEHNTWSAPPATTTTHQFLRRNSEDAADDSSAGSSGSSRQDDMLPPTCASPYKPTDNAAESSPVMISSFGVGVQVFAPDFFDTPTVQKEPTPEEDTMTNSPPSIHPSGSSTTVTTTTSTESPASSHAPPPEKYTTTTTRSAILNSSIEETTAEDTTSLPSDTAHHDALSQASSYADNTDDDDDDAADAPALANEPELHALLERLEGARREPEQRQAVLQRQQQQQQSTDARSVLSSPPALSTSSLFASHFQQTAAAMDHQHSASTSQNNSDDDDDDSGNHDNDDDDSDDDSFDYAAWTTKTSLDVMAPSPPTVPEAAIVVTPTTDLVQLSAQSRLPLDDDGSSGNDDDESDEEPHEGAQVFLMAQGNRYGGGGDDATEGDTKDGLVPARLQAVGARTPHSATGTLASRLMGSGSVSHTFASTPSSFLPTNEQQQQHVVNLHNLTEVQTPSGVWEDLTFTPGGTYMTPSNVDKEAATSPSALFASPPAKPVQDATTAPEQQPLFSPLSSMVHSIDLSLFQNNEPQMDESFSTIESFSDVRSVASCPVAVTEEPLLRSYSFDGGPNNRRLSSSFRSSQSRRVAYSLVSGKRSMTQAERLYSKALLPKRLDVGDKNKNEYPYKNDPNTVSVLLAHVQEHVFEVVAVHVYPDTTVGDVLSQARSHATDPVLAAQTYTSLCVGRHEYAAPMLPLHIVAHTGRLVTAVPEHVTAQTMQAVQTVLFRNPKLRQWWKQQQPEQQQRRHRRRPVSVEPRRTTVPSIATSTIVEDEGDSSCSSSSSDEDAKETSHNSSSSEDAERTLAHILSIASPRQDPSESFQLNQHVEL